MIDACSYIRYFASLIPDKEQIAPLLQYWRNNFPTGEGVTIGLIESDVDTKIPDLDSSDISIRNFAEYYPLNTKIREHGTHSVSILVGQGKRHIRGIAPKAHLFIASVIGPNGTAESETVERALKWLISNNVDIIAIPLGDDKKHIKIERLIEKGYKKGILFMAAAGNWHPMPLSFPARHQKTIAVGAADNFGKILPDCSRLPRLDLLAPGWNIFAPVNEEYVRSASGSSVACVIAAGAAVLLLADKKNKESYIYETILEELSGRNISETYQNIMEEGYVCNK